MVLRMTRPTRRSDSASHIFRPRIPADLVEKARGRRVTFHFPEAGPSHPPFATTVTIGKEHVKVSLRTRDASIAKLRNAIAEEHIQKFWQSLRSGPVHLTRKQIVALAGELYKDWTGAIEDDPISPELWEKVIAANEAAARGEFAHPLRINLSEQDRRIASLETRFGAFVDLALQRKALVIDDTSRALLLCEICTAMTEAAKKLKRNAEGDYRPDPTAERFPAWEDPKASAKATGGTLSGLVEDWWKEAQRTGIKIATYENYSSTFRMFIKFLGHDDLSRVTPDDVIRFKDFRLSQTNPRNGKPISPKTIKDRDLVALKSVFSWAVVNRRMSANPATGVTIKVRMRPKLREQGFTNAEAKAILTAAWHYQPGPREYPKTAAAKRWAPWLCAYSGARIGEIVQMRKEDVRREGDLWVMHITPEANTQKGDEARDVVLHPHLIELGFPEFVTSSGVGYLFIDPASSSPKAIRDAWKTMKNRVTEFVRRIVTDPDVQPNHGWRHRFKTVCTLVGIERFYQDVITGHKPRTVGERYGDVPVEALNREIRRLPRYEIDAQPQPTGERQQPQTVL